MNIDLDMITTNALVAVPIVIALVQAIKLTGFIKDHFSPLVAIAVGIVIAFIGNNGMNDLSRTMLSGVVFGLMSSGLYSGVKTTMVAHMEMKEKKRQKQAKYALPKDRNNC